MINTAKFDRLKYSVICGLMVQTTFQTCVVRVSGEGKQRACTIGMHNTFQLGHGPLEMVIKVKFGSF